MDAPTLLVALLAGGVGPVVAAVSNALKARRDARREDFAAAPALQASYEALYARSVAEAGRLRTDLEVIRDREDACAEALEASSKQVEGLRAEVAQLRRLLPYALLAGRLEEYAALGELLDLAADAWVISSPSDDGKILFANAPFCRILGRAQEEIVSLGWRALVMPADLERTQAAEGAAWLPKTGVHRHIARYARADGSWATLEWRFVSYERGVALSLVREQARIE